MQKTSITYKPLFWIGLFVSSFSILWISTRYFSTAFPLVNVAITMNRTQALQKAAELAQQLMIGPTQYDQAVSFETDSAAQTFVELEGGGKAAFNTMIQEHLYEPYLWKVRHFKEQNTQEVSFFFTPSGNPYGFTQTLSQETLLPSLSQDTALVQATTFAQQWVTGFALYTLIESSQETSTSGRVDHTFVFEQINQKIGEGRYRCKIIVQGNKIGALVPYIKIPESFTRRYQEMRSYNNSLATVAYVLMMLLYFFGGCLIALFFLLRRNWVLPKPALIAGIIVALFSTLTQINELPLAWMGYHTAHSSAGFLLQKIVFCLLSFLYNSVFFSVIFMAAESLTRKAFGNHIQLWQLAQCNVANSYQVVGRTVFGYLIVSVDIAIVVLFYLLTTRYAHWWMPSSVLFNPNILATYAPWFSPLALSLQAGFMEECLFRAIPLSIAALLGKRYGRKNWWIGGTFILQALIFGAAHANYPAQPFYARLVELIIPSCSFGAIYLSLGLLPAIVSHVVYDIGWFALPIFVATSKDAFLHALLVVIGALIPIWIILYQRIRAGSWTVLDSKFFNKSWQAPETSSHAQEYIPELPHTISRRFLHMFIFASLIAAVGWYRVTLFKQDARSIKIDRTAAIENATKYLTANNVTLGNNWSILGTAFTHYSNDSDERLAQEFVWQHDVSDKKNIYHTLMNTHYLKNPHFIVRFAQFTGDIIERAREYIVHLDHDGNVYQTKWILPESQQGAQLTEEDAQIIAQAWIAQHYQISITDLVEKSAITQKLPARKDWVFTFAIPKVYSYDDARAQINVTIAGNTVIESKQYIFVPEKWKREQQNQQQIAQSLQLICFIILFILFILGVAAAVSYRKIARNTFIGLFLFFIGLCTIVMCNNMGMFLALCSTSSPLFNQIFMIVSSQAVQILLQSVGFAMILALAVNQPCRHLSLPTTSIVFLASALGLLFAGLNTFVLSTQSSTQPTWAFYGPLTTYIPGLAIITHTLSQYSMLTAFVLLLMILANMLTPRNSSRAYLVLPLCVIAVAGLLGINGIPVIMTWVLQSWSMGIVLYLAWLQLIRYEIALVPLMTGFFYSTQLVQQLFFVAYNQAVVGTMGAIIIVLALSYYWLMQLKNS